LGMLKDSAIILDAIRRSFFDQISNSSNVYRSSSLILDGNLSRHLLPATFRLEIKNTTYKRLIRSQPHSHKPFTPILVFLSQIDRLWNKILRQLSSFPPSMTYKETRLYKTSYNSYNVEDKQTKLGVWTDGT
jgi:hypothetical protein